jgi:hypothetical protein
MRRLTSRPRKAEYSAGAVIVPLSPLKYEG